MDKSLLFKPNLTEVEHEIPGRGTVRIRTMTREELHSLRDKDTGVAERKVLAACVVDPQLTEDEVLLWQQASSAGELSDLVEKIMEISGLAEGASKSVLPGLST